MTRQTRTRPKRANRRAIPPEARVKKNPDPSILVVGLTGPNASGKGEVAKFLAAHGFSGPVESWATGVLYDSVTLDGHMVADATVLNQENTADWKIVELHDTLVTLKNNYKLLHPSDEWKGMVIVQADKGVDFKVIKKVMYSCAMAGYQNVNFAVQQKAKGS